MALKANSKERFQRHLKQEQHYGTISVASQEELIHNSAQTVI